MASPAGNCVVRIAPELRKDHALQLSSPNWTSACTQAELEVFSMIRKLATGEYRLYSRKRNPKTGRRRNLGTFRTREQAQQRERAVQFFKHR
jgi:hypothetical protein